MMAVRRPKLAHDLIQKWQNEKSEMGMPLNIEVCIVMYTPKEILTNGVYLHFWLTLAVG